MGRLNLAVLISGSGSNLQALIDACADENFPAKISIVISNRPDAYGIERARKSGIEAVVIDHTEFKTREDFEAEIQSVLEGRGIDLICLAGFMRILTADFIEKWPDKIINTHPSLLPKFGGKGMYGERVHRAVLDAGESESGCSIHIVIPEVDKGQVLVQKTVPVLGDDTVESLATRVIAQEHIAYVEAVQIMAQKG